MKNNIHSNLTVTPFISSLVILITLSFFSCRKDIAQDPANDVVDLVPEWQHDMDTLDNKQFVFSKPVVYQGDPVFTVYSLSGCNYGTADMVTSIHSETGLKQWGFNLDNPCAYHGNYVHLHDNILVINSTNHLQGYDLKTGNKLWEIEFFVNPYFSGAAAQGFGDRLFLEVYSGYKFQENTSALMEINVNTGQHRILIEYDLVTNYGSPGVNPPTLWLNPADGDSILFFLHGYKNLNQNIFFPNGSLSAFSLKEDKILWQLDSLGRYKKGHSKPVIYDNKVYTYMEKKLYCIDATSGEQLWDFAVDTAISGVEPFDWWNIVAYEGKIIAGASDYGMYCFDANTGQIIWHNIQHQIAASYELVVHNDAVYFYSNFFRHMVGVDVHSGNIICNIKTPKNGTYFNGEIITFDEEKNLLYLTDNWSTYAYRPVR